MLLSVFLVLLGVGLLYWGGELLVGSSIRLAHGFGVSRIVIGLTVVAFATSSPELAATITASLRGSPDIAIGNVFGSNVANLGLILGISALLYPLRARLSFIRREVAFMLVVTVLVYPLLWTDLRLGRLEGVVLIAGLALFLYTLIRDPESQQVVEDLPDDEQRPLWHALLGLAGGVALLVGGAQALVRGASEIALAAGVPERVIGLTLVALGTSLPELAACLVAARREEGDLVLGNLIGSNIFNLLCILGFTALVRPIPVAPQALAIDFWVTFAISALVLLFLALRQSMPRFEGLLLLACYVAYTVFLYL